MAVVNTS